MRAEAFRQLAAEPGLLDRGPNGARFPKPFFKIAEQCERTLDRVIRRLKLADAVSDDADDGFDAFTSGG